MDHVHERIEEGIPEIISEERLCVPFSYGQLPLNLYIWLILLIESLSDIEMRVKEEKHVK